MPLVEKKEEEYRIIFNPNMPDYSKDPFIIKKAEKAKAFIEKHGIEVKENKKSK